MPQDFENKYWQTREQRIVFRHIAALEMIERGPALDVGCGDGLFLELLKKKGIEGKGLDKSEVAVNKVRQKGLEAEQFDFVLKPLPFSDNSFAMVVMLDVLEHLQEPRQLLSEAKRVGKSIVLSVPNFNALPFRIDVLLGKKPSCMKIKQGHRFWFSYKVLKRMIQKQGLKIDCLKVNSFFSRWPLLRHSAKGLAKIWPSLFALNFVVRLSRKTPVLSHSAGIEKGGLDSL